VRKVASLLLAALLTAACGKKGDPIPPVPGLPARTTDLSAKQQGDLAIVTFTFPSQKRDGSPLNDLASIEIYRAENVPSSLLKPGPAASGPAHADRAPIPGERRRAQAVRLREGSFLASAKKIAVLDSAGIAQASRGGEIVYHESIREFFDHRGSAPGLTYAVVCARRGGERSELSNFATIRPFTPPGAPGELFAFAEEKRICLVWEPPPSAEEKAPEILYNVYRRTAAEEEFSRPLNSKPLETAEASDESVAYGTSYIYTITAAFKGHPESEGPPAIQFGIEYLDLYPPPPVSRLDALSEESVVRLIWTAVDAPDLAGYDLYRSAGNETPKKINDKLLTDTSLEDANVSPATTYRYFVRAVDRSGNASAPSPEAEGRPFREN
jgi:hypothetical protein